MKIGQDITGDRQMHVLIQFFADYLPVTSIQPQKPPDIIAKQSFFPDGKEETVHQKDDADGRGKKQKPQCNGDRLLHGHSSQGQGITGGKNRMVPGARHRTVHQRDHRQRKYELRRHARQKRIDDKLNHTSDKGSDRPRHHPVTALLTAWLDQKKCIERNPVRVGHRQQITDHTADAHHRGKPQRRAGLKGLRGEPCPNLLEKPPPAHSVNLPDIRRFLSFRLQDQNQDMQHTSTENAYPPFRNYHLIQMHLRRFDLMPPRLPVRLRRDLPKKCRHPSEKQHMFRIQFLSPFVVRQQIGEPLQQGIYHVVYLFIFCFYRKKVLLKRNLVKTMQKILKTVFQLRFFLRPDKKEHQIGHLIQQIGKSAFLHGTRKKQMKKCMKRNHHKKYTEPVYILITGLKEDRDHRHDHPILHTKKNIDNTE